MNKKDSKINDLINEVTKQDPIDTYNEWENYTKRYNFPVYKLNLGGKILVWKLPTVKESYDKKQSKQDEMVDKFFSEWVANNKED